MSRYAFPDANITFLFEGIAIFHLNPSSNTWEFLFLRHLSNHNLDVEINELTGGSIKPIHSFRIGKEHNLLIEAPNAEETPNNNARFEMNGFTYDASNEKEDIRWMEEETGSLTNCSFRSDFPKADLSFLSINGKSILYTYELSKNEFEIWEKVKDNKNLLAKRHIGIIVAADMKYPVGESIKIKVEGSLGYTLELPIEDGSLYQIKFDNTCDNSPTENQTSDYEHYYDLFDSSVKKIDITKTPKLTATGNVDLDSIRTGDVAACKCKTCRNLIGITSLQELV